MSKVFFVGNHYMGCYYVRCYLPMMLNGWSGTHYGLSQTKIKTEQQVRKEMMDADIIVFHRANTVEAHKLAMMMKSLGKKIVFDNDDTFKFDDAHPFMGLDEKGFKQNQKHLNNIVYNFIKNADLVTASTPYLAKEYREWNKNVVVLPNYVNPDDWDEPLRNETGAVRIGVVGSVAYHHDFERIKEVIKKLDNNPKVKLVLFGLWAGKKRKENPKVEEVHQKEFSFWDSLKNVEHVPWCSMSDYFDQLNQLRLDMMIIPRRENDFNKAKSNIKFLEAGMLEVPVIAQSFKDGPYENDIDGTNGILIKDDSEWYDQIMRLVDDKELRREMGKKARDYVLAHYDINNHYQEWPNTYSKLCEQ